MDEQIVLWISAFKSGKFIPGSGVVGSYVNSMFRCVCVCVYTGTCVCAEEWRSEVNCRCSSGAIHLVFLRQDLSLTWSSQGGDIGWWEHQGSVSSHHALEIELRPSPFSPLSHLPRPQALILWGGLLASPRRRTVAIPPGGIWPSLSSLGSDWFIFSAAVCMIPASPCSQDARCVFWFWFWYFRAVFNAHASDWSWGILSFIGHLYHILWRIIYWSTLPIYFFKK